MNDCDQANTGNVTESILPNSQAEESIGPVLDPQVFAQLRDVIRQHYLWRWDEPTEKTKERVRRLGSAIQQDDSFRIVGDIDIDENAFSLTLWLQDERAFTLASIDLLLLNALGINLGRSTLLGRELRPKGLFYTIISFGNGEAREYQIHLIGPRLQQIRDLGTLATDVADTFSA